MTASDSHRTVSRQTTEATLHISRPLGDSREPVVAYAKLEVSSDLRELERVREFVRHVCRELSGEALDVVGTREVTLAATEAASNIIQHACRGQNDHRIAVHGEVLSDRICIELSHDGSDFDAPTQIPEPNLDTAENGGMGLYIMARTVDDVRYSRSADNRRPSTTLIKNRSRRSETGSEHSEVHESQTHNPRSATK